MLREKQGDTGGHQEPLYQKEFLESLQERSSAESMARLAQGTFDRKKPFNPKTPFAEKDAKEVIKTPSTAITEKVTNYRKTAWEAWDKYQEENNTGWLIEEGVKKNWQEMSEGERQEIRLRVYAVRQAEEVWDKFKGKDQAEQDNFRKGLQALGLDWSKAKAGNADNIWQRDAFKNFLKSDLYQKYFSLNRNTAYEILQSLIEKSTNRGFLVDSELVGNIQSLQPFLTALFGEKQAFDALSAVADLYLVVNKHPDFYEALKDYDGKTMVLGKGKTVKLETEQGILDYLKGASCQKDPLPLSEQQPAAPKEETASVISKTTVPPLPEKKDKAAGSQTESKEDVGKCVEFGLDKLEWQMFSHPLKPKFTLRKTGIGKLDVRVAVNTPEVELKNLADCDISILDSVFSEIDKIKDLEDFSNKIALAVEEKYEEESVSEIISGKKGLAHRILDRLLPNEVAVEYKGRSLKVVLEGTVEDLEWRFHEGDRVLPDSEVTNEMRREFHIASGKKILKAWAALPPSEEAAQTSQPAPSGSPESDGRAKPKSDLSKEVVESHS